MTDKHMSRTSNGTGRFEVAPRQRVRYLGLPFSIAALLISTVSFAESAPSTEEGTQLVIDTLLKQDESAQDESASEAPATPSDPVAAARAADSLKITEYEEVIDPDSLSPEERAQLSQELGTWKNTTEPSPPAVEPFEMVEPVQIRESEEQVVEASELTPEQIAEFPALKTAPLPEPAPAAAPEPEPAKMAEAPVTDAEPEKMEAPEKKAAPREVRMPAVTRWAGRPR